MVHGELIKAGLVQPLTYKQLRRLERDDLKKARELHMWNLAEQGVIAGGQAARGLFQGNITGPITLFLLLASEPQLLALAYQNLASAAGIIGSAIKTGLVPDVQGFLNKNQANPTPTTEPRATGGIYGLHQTGATVFQVGGGDLYYSTRADRDQAVVAINGDLWNRFVGKHATQTWELDSYNNRINVVDLPLPPAWIFPLA